MFRAVSCPIGYISKIIITGIKMNTKEKISRIRKKMDACGIAAVVIPGSDPHKSEYVAEHWQARKWLTGFSGSAGIAAITSDNAVLWTDFRYYIQAEKQIAGSPFVLFRTGQENVPDVWKWLAQTLAPGSRVGIDGALFAASEVRRIRSQLENREIGLDTDIDVMGDIWEDRPGMPVSRAFSLAENFAGQGRKDKIVQIKNAMADKGACFHLMASLDDIAWTLNLRGSDIHTNPVNIAFVLIGPEKLTLFMDRAKVDDKLACELGSDGVEIAGYEAVYGALADIPGGSAILVDPDNVNYRLFNSISKKIRIIETANPAAMMKAVKNETQIAHMKDTAVKDGAAVVNFLYMLEHLSDDEDITELGAAEKLNDFRRQQQFFVDNSFDPIVAFQDHSAMCHYSPSRETDVVIGSRGILLMDSGGHYLTGTTDITRTIVRGKPSKREILDYTLVLKGHISVASAVFPAGTRGYQIDTLARQYLWAEGLDFGHGTGHGVGFFLCVHEGPAAISPRPVDVKLEKGMVLTNEPGIYRDNYYGIRLENMVLVEDAFHNEFGTFLRFENLTYCHFERDLIDDTMLSADEKKWINEYHMLVYEKLSPVLAPDVASWLSEKTRPI